ncbi:MAG: isochorismatase family protein [Neisseriaceae bacterium]|nr:isochorismatase family protein [Neisseriaceae bacterium]MBP6862282.1 isochorismatase family protein [Neisseriaceae bacterium]
MSIVAIDVDAQQTFTPLCPDELPVAGGADIVAALNAQAALAQYRVLTKDAHSPKALWVVADPKDSLQPLDLPNADLTWVAHAVPGTKGFEALPGLPAVIDYDFVVYKGIEPDMHPYGACFHDFAERLSTGLIEWLKIKEAKTIILGGLAEDYCVKTTALQLAKYGAWRVIVNLEATRGIAPETTAAARVEMAEAGVTLVADTTALKALLI